MQDYKMISASFTSMDDISRHERNVRGFMAKRPFSRTGLSDKEIGLFCAALTHDSYTDEATKLNPPRDVESYERLEFLGDAVVELLACEHVFNDTDLREGKMTDYKQEIVGNDKISDKVIAYGLDIDSVLLVGHGHRVSGGISVKMRADAFEALIGAVYTLYGLDEARRIVKEVLFRN